MNYNKWTYITLINHTFKANIETFGFRLFISLTICMAASRGLIKEIKKQL